MLAWAVGLAGVGLLLILGVAGYLLRSMQASLQAMEEDR